MHYFHVISTKLDWEHMIDLTIMLLRHRTIAITLESITCNSIILNATLMLFQYHLTRENEREYLYKLQELLGTLQKTPYTA